MSFCIRAPFRQAALWLFRRLLDVIAGGECPAPRAGHHQHTDLVVGIGLRNSSDDLIDQWLAQRIVPLGAVQRDGGNAVVHCVA
jgi:hypothetical protein